jgi:hypothetical protein
MRTCIGIIGGAKPGGESAALTTKRLPGETVVETAI